MTHTSLGLDWTNERTRKREFLGGMERVVPWSALMELIEPHSTRAKMGRPPFPIETMLRTTSCRTGSLSATKPWRRR